MVSCSPATCLESLPDLAHLLRIYPLKECWSEAERAESRTLSRPDQVGAPG